MKKFMTSCITILLLTTFAYTKPRAPMSAQEIIERMVEVYASCRTYSDEGEVNTDYVGGLSKAPIGRMASRRQPFLTAFVRPSSFRFEFSRRGSRDGWDRYIAWKEGDLEKAWWLFDSEVGAETLERALLNMGLLSDGAALTVPSLLLPNHFRGTSILTALDELKLTGEEKVDDRKTFKLEGKFQGKELKLWIDQREFLIIKMRRKLAFGPFEFEITTKYNPQVNGDISAEKLAFNPPSDRRANRGSPPNIGPSSSLGLNSSASGRSHANESPRLRNFGSSLKANTKAKPDTKKKRSRDDEDDIVRVDTDLVVCDVLVLDKQGKWIKGLGKDDFVVKEDDIQQEVGSFSLGDVKTIQRSIVLIIDYSGSQLPYIKTSIEAAKTLIDKLNPTDRVAIVTDDVELLVDFTSDKELLKARLESLKTSALSGKTGRSEQYDALVATLRELFDEEDVRPIIIFQTDGDQLNKLATPPNPYILQKIFTIEEIMTAAEKARATIYSIIPFVRFVGLSEEEQLQKAKADWKNRMESFAELRRMKNQPEPRGPGTISDKNLSQNAAMWHQLQLALVGLAKYTGGWSDFLERPDQADDVYTRILNDINQRYIIGYYPTNRARDGKRRKVTMEVRGHPEYIVWGRKTYFSPEPD
jgi:VWFA-related protein